MAILDDRILGDRRGNIEVVRPVGRRRITHVIHDVDGTHSLIRQWPPVMSLVIHYAMHCGLAADFDSEENAAALVEGVGREPLPETDEFCVETAGLSALTQMEYGIRRAVQLGNVPDSAGLSLTESQAAANADVISRIAEGEERFPDVDEPAQLAAFITEYAPRLFRLYEDVLNKASRDSNTADAREHPERWRVPGSLEFLAHLHSLGCTNYFVTGAVIYADGGMFEEVAALGFRVGPGRLVHSLEGSSWDRKEPKDEVMRDLCRREGIDPTDVLVVGDGRTEIRAGIDMGCVVMSRLPEDAVRPRALHRELGTNYILPDFTSPLLRKLIRAE
jgi:phosphoglycolate phosphatase-like HAD superfamily hydrolase